MIETDLSTRAVWLSGIFEAKGSMGMTISNTTHKQGENIYRYQTASPFMSCNDLQYRSEALKEIFGGHVQKQTDVSFCWSIWKNKAAEVASFMRLYSPSRRSTIDAFESWLNETSPSQRVQIASELRERGTKNNVTNEKYKELLINPVFTAGVFDAIGHASFKETYDDKYLTSYSYPKAVLYSTNQQFLEAFKEIFGGALIVADKKGKSITRRGDTYTTLNDSLELVVGPTDSQKLFELIHPHTVFTRNEVLDVLTA